MDKNIKFKTIHKIYEQINQKLFKVKNETTKIVNLAI